MADGGYTPLVNVGELPCICVMCNDVCMAEPGVIGPCAECRSAAVIDGECHPKPRPRPESAAGAALRRAADRIAKPSREQALTVGQEGWDTAIRWAAGVLRHEANVEDLKELARGR